MIRTRSLAKRIFLASCIMMPFLLCFSGYMLDRAFRNSLLNAEKESLLAHTYSMMGIADPAQTSLNISQPLSDPRFSTPASGLYAQLVRSENQFIVWQSESLSVSPVNGKIPFHEVAIGESEVREIRLGKTDYFISRFNTVWEIEDRDQQYQFVIVHTQDSLQEELKHYRRTLAIWLGGLALLLIVVQTVIVRWGLFPLQKLAEDIQSLESGKIQLLDEDYPEEIVPVTRNVNLLLESEQRQQKRYKNTLADLAHSLKTPLSVIRSVLQGQAQVADSTPTSSLQHAIDEQIDRMSAIVNHQLNRASAKSKAVFQASLPLAPMFSRIGNALQKVYRDKNIAFTNTIDETIEFAAEEGDLMEVFGNILENAFKYGSTRVHVSCRKRESELCLIIDDDGPGVADNMRRSILQRGSRIDTKLPGQGIGLAVAADIISSYDGGISVASSEFGGASFVIELPL